VDDGAAEQPGNKAAYFVDVSDGEVSVPRIVGPALHPRDRTGFRYIDALVPVDVDQPARAGQAPGQPRAPDSNDRGQRNAKPIHCRQRKAEAIPCVVRPNGSVPALAAAPAEEKNTSCGRRCPSIRRSKYTGCVDDSAVTVKSKPSRPVLAMVSKSTR